MTARIVKIKAHKDDRLLSVVYFDEAGNRRVVQLRQTFPRHDDPHFGSQNLVPALAALLQPLV